MTTSIVRDFIAAELAVVPRDREPPTAPFGYGTDISCAEDLRTDLGDVDGLSIRALGEAIVRRLGTPRGTLPDDADYGLDLRAMCNTGTTAATIRELASKIRSEIVKDDRIQSVVVTVAPSSTGSSMGVTLAVTPADPTIATFSLTLAVTDAEILLREMTP